MQVKINSDVMINFTPQGISYVLDMLANCPWKVANPLITDIMGQLKSQESPAAQENVKVNPGGEA